MSPLTTPLPKAERGREIEQLGEMKQAGRSTQSLEVEKSAALLRSDSAPTSPTPDSPTSSFHSILDPVPATIPQSADAPAGHAYTPLVRSPLNDSSASSIAESADPTLISRPSDSSAEQHSASSQSALLPGGVIGAGAIPLGNKYVPPGRQYRRSGQFSPTTRPESQRLLGDMSFGYSRYPLSSRGVTGNSRPAAHTASAVALLGPASSTTSLAAAPVVGANPFSDANVSDVSEKWLYFNERMGAFDPYSDGDKDFIRYRDEIEDDDPFHQPTADDEKRARPTFKEIWAPRVLPSTIGLIVLIIGLLLLFILVPILAFTGTLNPAPREDDTPDYGPAWAHVNNNTYPLLQNVRRGLIDPDTPEKAMTRQSTFDGSTLNLVFSDEFNQNNRTFYPGDDPYWTAPDIWYGATQDLEWYDPAAATTYDGTLQLQLDQYANHGLQFRSGMLNSWNQLCFKGGVMEVSISLPGPAGVPGLWPGVWSMGNLGRPGYKATTEGVWPYTYDECDLGITPNQSSPDGMSELPGQKLASCVCDGEDHPNPGTGRGAPEIDVIEASVDPNNMLGVVTQSFQVAPFDVFWRPNSNFLQIPNYNTTQMNGYCGGPFQQAISGTTVLNSNWYDGVEYQKYAFEYIPGKADGKIAWFVGEDQSFMMDGRAIGQNGNAGPRQVSEEPMSMVLNLGISTAWGEILYADLKFPTIMRIDYVRIYQREGEEMITCDPPGYPTTQYIADHPIAYNNPNLTAWNETGYGWPKHKLNSDEC